MWVKTVQHIPHIPSKFHILFFISVIVLAKVSAIYLFFKSFSVIFSPLRLVLAPTLSLSLVVCHFSATNSGCFIWTKFFSVCIWIEIWRCGWWRKTHSQRNECTKKKCCLANWCTYFLHLPFALVQKRREKKGSSMKICSVSDVILNVQKWSVKAKQSNDCNSWWTHKDFSFGDMYT